MVCDNRVALAAVLVVHGVVEAAYVDVARLPARSPRHPAPGRWVLLQSRVPTVSRRFICVHSSWRRLSKCIGYVRAISLWRESSLNVHETTAPVILRIYVCSHSTIISLWATQLSLPALACRRQCPLVVTVGSSRRAPRLLAVETCSNSVCTTDHLGCRFQQVVSWFVEKSIVDIGPASTDNSVGVLWEHLVIVSTLSLQGHCIDVIWTCRSLLWMNCWVVSLWLSTSASKIGRAKVSVLGRVSVHVIWNVDLIIWLSKERLAMRRNNAT